ncbi:MAG: dienelactone hydrolase family protein [Deltaproteobacteria bacterium]|nr:dienelactone hydrolase family protein [Deltaproteobacteria bacterium]
MIKTVTIPLPPQDAITGKITLPTDFQAGRNPGLILAHGAGNDSENPLLVFLAEGLARSGVLALRFNFPYKEKGRTAPDRPEVLEAAWEAAFHFLTDHPRYRPAWVLAAGKSMGGRLASQAAASGRLPVRGLIFYGYPLHSPGHPEKLRDAHLYALSIPMVFFAGTRDPFCQLDLLKPVLARVSARWHLEIIEGGDHSFEVPKSTGRNREAVYQGILDKTVELIEGGFFDG